MADNDTITIDETSNGYLLTSAQRGRLPGFYRMLAQAQEAARREAQKGLDNRVAYEPALRQKLVNSGLDVD